MLSDIAKQDYYDMFFSAEELSQEEFEFIHAINNGKNIWNGMMNNVE